MFPYYLNPLHGGLVKTAATRLLKYSCYSFILKSNIGANYHLGLIKDEPVAFIVITVETFL